MKLLIDNEIPFINGVFEPFGEVEYLSGEDFIPERLRDADAILVKGHTRCDAALLEGSSEKMIATTLVSIDHIDLDYCNSHGIFVQNAKGTISGAVSNYVFSAIYGCAAKRSINLSGATFGILGYGSVGKRIESAARALGFKVLIEDPPKSNVESPSHFTDLDYLLENSDIVSLHLPLNERTKGMCNSQFFNKMKFGSFFINAASGALVVDEDLIEASPKLGPIIIDCWNNEPDINRELLDLTDIATPHIAGYSFQGKQNGTRCVVRSMARFFGINELYDFFPKPDIEGMESIRVDIMGKTQGQIASIFQYNYPIFTDDFLFRMAPENFTELRLKYKYRREFHIL